MTALDWRALADALDHVQEVGGHVPCRAGDLAQTRGWIATSPAEQRVAAAACADCAALAMCREYAESNPLEAGVLGGLTEFDRKPKPARPATAKNQLEQGGGCRERHEA